MSHHDTLSSTVLLGEEPLGVVEVRLPPAWDGPPLHHHDFDEAFYVLDGELTLQLGEEVATVGPGTLTFAPRGSRHTLANTGEAPARYLLICTPGGFERMFARLEARAAGEEPSVEALRPFPETVVVGPTLFERLGR
jgi:mannose-6-phosphate isomerase-like protein (cupin superfamily)